MIAITSALRAAAIAAAPAARMVAMGFVAGGAVTGGSYTMTRLIRRFEPKTQAPQLTREEKLRAAQMQILCTAAGPGGALADVAQDPKVRDAILAIDKLIVRTETIPLQAANAA